MLRGALSLLACALIISGAACASRPPPPPDPLFACEMHCSDDCARNASEWYVGCAMNCRNNCMGLERRGFGQEPFGIGRFAFADAEAGATDWLQPRIANGDR